MLELGWNLSAHNPHHCQLTGPVGPETVLPDLSASLRSSSSFSPLRIMLAVGLSYVTFIMLRYVPSIPTLSKINIHTLVKGIFDRPVIHEKTKW